MTKVLALAAIGRLHLQWNGGDPVRGLTSGKAQALLCYLAVSKRPFSRQVLAGLLWGEIPEADARRNLRGVALKLRRAVGDYLLITHQTLAFNDEMEHNVDTAVFRSLLANQPTLAAQSQAIALYRGDFLDGFYVRQAPLFEGWVMQQRGELRELAIGALVTLTDGYTAQGEYKTAVSHARHLLQLDPWREEGHRQLMTALALGGQRAAALTHYTDFHANLGRELGIEPDGKTAVLHNQIRSGHITPPTKIAINLTSDTGSPFIAGPPIPHPARFFGRERELRRLFNLFKRLPLQNAAIIGARRSGKTSLLHYISRINNTPAAELRAGQRADWLPNPAQYRWIFVDFQDPRMGDAENLLRYLLAKMEMPSPDLCDLENFLDIVSDNLNRPTIILFDEIGVALDRYPTLDDAFWESLRSLATNQTGGQLAFVLSAHESPQKLAQHGGLGSPFFNIFGYTAMLDALTEAEARQLLAASPLPFPAADVEWILEKSGRWPIALQILGRERLLALEEGETDDAWKAEGLRQIEPFRID